ncbi:hypothetical protein OG393_21035 [Streptomyces sp. NBC_01216]|uniref:hypothetical protein n=1 Tax=Streptomyces sp. NBC_01216 TaxID=2903778 RepID=UPI002E12FA89|nr:hypothetical protein OG393_21035 [Streptomyces sp. NBC_01216]
MTFPTGTPTITLTGTLPSALAGTGYNGRVVLTPSTYLVDTSRSAIYPGGGTVDITDGTFTATILPNDAAGIGPAGWRWRISIEPLGAPVQRFWAYITGTGTVDISTLIPVPAPDGGDAGSGAVSSVNGQAGVVVLTYADVGAEQSGAVTTHTEATDPHGDRAYADNAFLAQSNNLTDLTDASAARTALGLGDAALLPVGTTAGTVAAGDDSRFDDIGGGSSITTASVRITDDNLSGLPSTTPWAIVQTSAGTQLKASIAAAAGDRIKVYGRFMYAGAHFLDWVLLDSAGSIAEYAASETSSPLAEGNPAMYPSTAFSKATSGEMFTVGAGHIDGSGNTTIALAHSGTSAGTVYAHTLYPWRLRLENIGPEPA